MNTTPAWIKGIIPPIVTPIDDDERVNESALRRIIDHVIAGGVHGILALGSNGEFFGLEEAEQKRVAEITIEHCAGRVPVYVGIGSIATKACVRWARWCRDAGADAISVLAPMFLSPNDDELYEHFRSVATAVDLPVLVYNNPDRLRCGISATLAERLAAVGTIFGIKESSGDLTLTAECIRRTAAHDFRVFAGRDILILGTLAYGGVGAVAATANVVPKLVVDIYNRYAAGDLAGARAAQFRLAPLRMAFSLGSFPVVTKDYMRLLDFAVGEPIRPNRRCADAQLAQLQAHLDQLRDVL